LADSGVRVVEKRRPASLSIVGEFELIERVFRSRFAALSTRSAQVDLGIGDDCALLAPRPGMQLAVSTDMLVEGRHFLPTVDASALGHKALAVNLSDLAACGARPLGFTLALALPRVDAAWLEAFADGLLALARAQDCPLVGGDTTAGPLNVCITVFGEVPRGQALLRSGARVGDEIWVSHGTGEALGQARCALEVFRGTLALTQADFAHARTRMERPTPRVALGMALRGTASAAADVSDGLIGDLGHILRASSAAGEVDIGAEIDLHCLPVPTYNGLIDAPFATKIVATNDQHMPTNSPFFMKKSECLSLTGGDDYELVFTAAPQRARAVADAAQAAGCQASRIGRIVRAARGSVALRAASGERLDHAERTLAGFDHFAA
jgi:thiamine-monophosphate kinase